MSEEDTHRDLIQALELAWDLECGISWYDVTETKKKLNFLRWKYHIDPYDLEDINDQIQLSEEKGDKKE